MKRWHKWLLWIACGALCGTVAHYALAHDHWIARGQYRDPVTKDWCCGENDCKPLREDQVEYIKDYGYRIKTTGEMIPFARMIAAEPDDDHQARYWVCRWGFGADGKFGQGDGHEIRCFFAPVGGV